MISLPEISIHFAGNRWCDLTSETLDPEADQKQLPTPREEPVISTKNGQCWQVMQSCISRRRHLLV